MILLPTHPHWWKGLILFAGKPQVVGITCVLNSFPLFLWSEMLLALFCWQEAIICSFPSVRTAISRLGRLRASCCHFLVLVANHFLQMLTSMVSFLLYSRRYSWVNVSLSLDSQQIPFSYVLAVTGEMLMSALNRLRAYNIRVYSNTKSSFRSTFFDETIIA